MSESIFVDIDKIAVGQRHRKELGDLTPLIESIEEVGLLHPIVLTDSYELVAGQRRLEAVKKLGHLEIEARILPLSPVEMLRAEHDENTVRLDFRPTEMVALGQAIEVEVAKQRRNNMSEGGRYGESPDLPGATRDIVGKAVGVSGSTYEKAKQVVEAAASDPKRFGDLADQMDSTGNIWPVHAELKKRQSDLDHKAPTGPRPKMMPINSADKIVSNVSHSLHAAVVALEKINLNGAPKEEVTGWISDLEDPLRSIRKTIRTWKERV